jgi:hypothetical protein
MCGLAIRLARAVSFEANFLNFILEESGSDKNEIELERAQQLDTSCISTSFFSSCIISIGEVTISTLNQVRHVIDSNSNRIQT